MCVLDCRIPFPNSLDGFNRTQRNPSHVLTLVSQSGVIGSSAKTTTPVPSYNSEEDNPDSTSKKRSSGDDKKDPSVLNDDLYIEDDTFYVEATHAPTPFAPRRYIVLSLILSLQSTESNHFSSLYDIPLHPILVILVAVISFLCLTGIVLLIVRVYVVSLALHSRYAYAQSLYTEKEKVLCRNWREERECSSTPLIDVPEAVLNDITLKN